MLKRLFTITIRLSFIFTCIAQNIAYAVMAPVVCPIAITVSTLTGHGFYGAVTDCVDGAKDNIYYCSQAANQNVESVDNTLANIIQRPEFSSDAHFKNLVSNILKIEKAELRMAYYMAIPEVTYTDITPQNISNFLSYNKDSLAPFIEAAKKNTGIQDPKKVELILTELRKAIAPAIIE